MGFTQKYLRNWGKPSVSLFHIFLSLQQAVLPIQWKSANISKRETRPQLETGPVSPTCVACKMLEGLIQKHLMQHLEPDQLLTPAQHGFRPERSSLINLLETLEA